MFVVHDDVTPRPPDKGGRADADAAVWRTIHIILGNICHLGAAAAVVHCQPCDIVNLINAIAAT